MLSLVEWVARAIDPVAWAWIDKVSVEDPKHIALAGVKAYSMKQARAALKEVGCRLQSCADELGREGESQSQFPGQSFPSGVACGLTYARGKLEELLKEFSDP